MKTILPLLSAFIIATTCFGQGGTGDLGQRRNDFTNDVTNIGSGTIEGNVTLTGNLDGAGSVIGLKHVKVTLSSADLLALYSAPKQLIASPGAGHSIAISKVNFAITRTSTAYTGGGAAIIQYDSTVHGGGTQACDSTIASTVITGAAGLSNTLRNGAIISDSGVIDNKGIYMSAATADFAAGTGTAVADVWYYTN